MIPKFPEVCVQSIADSWWEDEPSGEIRRGRLIRVIVPYPDMKPWRMVPEGRGDNERQHGTAKYRIETFQTGSAIGKVSTLPVAAMPLREGETFLVQRGKIRPALVLATEGLAVSKELRAGSARWQSNPTLLVSPYYGATQDGSRGGWPKPFVDRIQRAEYSQYVWDTLPIGGSDDGSILRLDHVFPIGADPANWQPTPYRLSAEAMAFIDEWFSWHVTGEMSSGGLVELARTELPKA